MVLMTAERVSMPGEAARARKEKKKKNGREEIIMIIQTAHQRGAVLSGRQAGDRN